MTSYVAGYNYGYWVDMSTVDKRVDGDLSVRDALEEEVGFAPTSGDLAALTLAYREWKRCRDAS